MISEALLKSDWVDAYYEGLTHAVLLREHALEHCWNHDSKSQE